MRNFKPGRIVVISTRNGFTMFEVVLTMAIIVIVAAISIPVINSLMANSKQTEARDFIQAALTKARSKALESGKPYRFEITISQYRIVPDDEMTQNESEQFGQPLPKHVTFSGINRDGQQYQSDNSWQTVATFLPDGTAEQDVEISFQVNGSTPTVLKLRAVTGAVTTAMAETRWECCQVSICRSTNVCPTNTIDGQEVCFSNHAAIKNPSPQPLSQGRRELLARGVI